MMILMTLMMMVNIIISIVITPAELRGLDMRVGKTWVDLEAGCNLILIVLENKLDRLESHQDENHGSGAIKNNIFKKKTKLHWM